MSMKDAIQRMVNEQIKVQVLVGTVKSVDETKMVCDVDLTNAPDLLDVRLRSIIDENDKGVLIVPKKDSHVLVGIIDNRIESAFVLSFSEVEKIRLITDEIELSGNDFGGLIKIEELVSKINRLEDKLNSLVNKHNTHIHITTATVSATPTVGTIAPTTSSETPIAPNTQKSDLENEKVKHG